MIDKITQPNSPRKQRWRAIEGIMKDFCKMQETVNEWFRKWEDEQWKKELEMEERRCQEDREHEHLLVKMMVMQGTTTALTLHPIWLPGTLPELPL